MREAALSLVQDRDHAGELEDSPRVLQRVLSRAADTPSAVAVHQRLLAQRRLRPARGDVVSGDRGLAAEPVATPAAQIVRTSWGERVCQYVDDTAVDVVLKKKKYHTY